tara:strand:+ start:842 stop:1648 length:807 start_codon:yes stop_codon:yes gene_type:complete
MNTDNPSDPPDTSADLQKIATEPIGTAALIELLEEAGIHADTPMSQVRDIATAAESGSLEEIQQAIDQANFAGEVFEDLPGDHPRRVKIISVSREMMLELLTPHNNIWSNYRWDESSLPKDLKIVQVDYIGGTMSFDFVVHSSSFPVVTGGMMPDQMECTISVTHRGDALPEPRPGKKNRLRRVMLRGKSELKKVDTPLVSILTGEPPPLDTLVILRSENGQWKCGRFTRHRDPATRKRYVTFTDTNDNNCRYSTEYMKKLKWGILPE